MTRDRAIPNRRISCFPGRPTVPYHCSTAAYCCPDGRLDAVAGDECAAVVGVAGGVCVVAADVADVADVADAADDDAAGADAADAGGCGECQRFFDGCSVVVVVAADGADAVVGSSVDDNCWPCPLPFLDLKKEQIDTEISFTVHNENLRYNKIVTIVFFILFDFIEIERLVG